MKIIVPQFCYKKWCKMGYTDHGQVILMENYIVIMCRYQLHYLVGGGIQKITTMHQRRKEVIGRSCNQTQSYEDSFCIQ